MHPMRGLRQRQFPTAAPRAGGQAGGGRIGRPRAGRPGRPRDHPVGGALPPPLAPGDRWNTFSGMPARWGSFAVGLGLVLAPLALGYGSAGAILQEVAVGLLVCIGALAALEWPRARFLLTGPGLWLVHTGRGSGDPRASLAELAAGALLLALTLVPSRRRVLRGALHAPPAL